MRLLKTNLVES